MSNIPKPYNSISEQIDRWHERNQSQPRPHLGVSAIGDPDDRGLWLGFRWVFQQQFNGRILRLFRRGHNEERVIVEDLERIGLEPSYTLEAQLRVDFGSHVSGSCDGIIPSGVPEAPSKPHLLEIKTINRVGMNKLERQGVEKAHPNYYVQAQCYMYGLTEQGTIGTDINRCLFIAVCKDDDSIYTERIRLNKGFAKAKVERAQSIAISERMPEPVYFDPSHFEAKFSPYYAVYFPNSATADDMARLKTMRGDGSRIEHKLGVNCRTCAHSTPTSDSQWLCSMYDNSPIPVEFQRAGCRSHAMHPDIMTLIGWGFVDGDRVNAIYRSPDGAEVKNGADGVSSDEMLGGQDYEKN